MVRQLELIDTFLAAGQEEFTFEDAKVALGRSPAATANALRQLNEKGLVDRLTRGTTRSGHSARLGLQR